MRVHSFLPKAAVRSFWIVLVFVVCGRPAFGQTVERPNLFNLGTSNGGGQSTRGLAMPILPDTPLEGAVDPASYVVGPGDLFQVTIGGAEPLTLPITVTAEGALILPEGSNLQAAGELLATVRRDAMAVLQDRFRNVAVSVSLAKPRQFYVHVTGAVPLPGRYPVPAVARVSNVVELAFSDNSQAPVTNPDLQPSLRNVVVHRKDSTQFSVDLRRYYATGDTKYNPYLQDGDVISMGVYNPTYESVFINGAVAFPGRYDYRDGDTVLDLLHLTAGASGVRTLQTVRLSRQRDDGTVQEQLLDVQAMLQGNAPLPQVEPLDHLYVIPKAQAGGTVTVDGYVQYPGTYAIELGRSTVQQVLQRAGGLREAALARGAYLIRPVFNDARPPLATSIPKTGLSIPASLFQPNADPNAVTRRMRLADLDFLSRVYFAQETQLQNRVPLNLSPQAQGTADPILLQDGDRIIVPRDDGTVFVFGQVNEPGYVTYRPERTVEAYIQATGGRAALATETYVVKAGTGEFLSPENTTIQSGDALFVDRQDMADDANLQRLLMEENRMRADARIRTTQVILQVVTTAATLITTYMFVRNN